MPAVIVNTDIFPKEALEVYAKCHEEPVVDDLGNEYYTVVRTPLLSDALYEKSQADTLVRSLIRHDSTKLATTLVSLL